MASQPIDFSDLGGKPVPPPVPGAIDFSDLGGKQVTATSAQPPSAASRLWENFKSGLGITNDEGAKNFFEHPINTLMSSFQGQGELAQRAKDSYSKGDYVGAIQHGINYLLPFVGPQLDQAGEQAKQGDTAGAIGRTLGVSAPIIAGSSPVRGAAMDATAAAKSAVQKAFTPDAAAQAQAAHTNFMKAIPPTKTTPYTPDDLQAARPYLEDEHAGTPIQSVSDVKDAANSAIGRIENKVHEYIRANPQDQIATDPLAAVQSKLAPTNSLRNGFTDAGLKELEPYNLDQPMTVAKADALRRQFNAENNAFEAKNSVDKAQARATDPAYAAREAASQSLRDGIYGKLEDRGIPDVQQLRQDEGSIIAIRDAAQNQLFRGDQGVARTGSTSIPGRMARSAIQLGTTGGGAAIGGMVAGAPGAAGGAIIGGGLGEAINRVAFPGNLTRDALIEKSFSGRLTDGVTLPEAPARPSIRGLLNAPATELGPSTMTNPPSAAPAWDMNTTPARKGLLLNEPSPRLPQPGYTEPLGEPIGTPIGLKPEPFRQPQGWHANISTAGASNAVPSTPESAVPSPSGAGELGARAEVPGPRAASQPVSSGTATSVHVSEGQSYPAQYQVRELADVQPSHSGITFEPNSKYGLNHANLANNHEVEANASAGKFDPSQHLTDAMNAEHGPLVIDEAGHPLGNSNENAMTLQRVYDSNPDGAAAYRKMLVNKSPQFGVDPMQIMRMKQPVLVRQIADDDLISGTKQSAEGEQSLPFGKQQNRSTQISK